jgi:hypothetical protein
MFAELHGVDVWHGEALALRLLEVYRPRPDASGQRGGIGDLA